MATVKLMKRMTAIALACLLVLSAGCQLVRPGGRCRGSGFGERGEMVFQCRGRRWTPFATKAQVVGLFVYLLRNGAPAPGEVVRPTAFGQPTFEGGADNSVYVEGATNYVFSTKTFLRVPVRTLTDIDTPAPANDRFGFGQTTEAMPAAVPWAAHDEVWAPSVGKLGGRYVMFFATFRLNPPDPSNDQSVGRAFADSPAGPYEAETQPFICGYDGIHGALDPGLYVAPDGSATLHVAFGGSPDNIWGIPLDGGGNMAAAPVKMLSRHQPWEDWFLENPSMIFDGTDYVLAYSAGHWNTPGYTTGIARCKTPTGPCSSSPNGPWLSSIGDRVGPGGLSFFMGTDGQARVIFHTFPASNVSPTSRGAHVARVAFDPWPRLF